MALLLWLLTALVPCLIGMGALCVLYRSRTAQEWCLADCILTGGMISIGLAEAAHLIAVVLGWSFSRCTKVFAAAVLVCCVVALVVSVLNRENLKNSIQLAKGNRCTQTPADNRKAFCVRIPWILFGVVVIVQLISVVTMQSVYITGDMTLETVNSFLESDGVYRVNPLTGGEYTLGMPMRLRILCLPSLYGYLCQIFGITPEALIYGMIPAFVLLASYLAYHTLARYFFSDNAEKRGLFMLLAAVLFGAGDYMYGMDGFGILHSGFCGVAIRGAVLLPYTFGLMLRKKYKLVVLCVLAEACIVWTLYGMGACLLVAVGMLALSLFMKWYDKRAGRGEDAVCRNS